MTTPEFQAFNKIPRLFRTVIVTEKIDGTNGIIHVSEDGVLTAGSRNRWLQPGKNTDNYGFAGWVEDNKEELLKLGPGYHYGEWWGAGIQRGYGLSEKRFSLFNTNRWTCDNERPACCHVVPVLAAGDHIESVVAIALRHLRAAGSFAEPGFKNPEGVVAYHVASGHLFKVTLEDDEKPKGGQ